MIKQGLNDNVPADLREWVDHVLKERGWSARQWSLAATGKPDTVRNIQRGGSQAPRIDTLRKLAETAGVQLPGLSVVTAPISPFPSHIDTSGYPRDVPIREGALCGEDGAFDFESQTADLAPRPPRLAAVKDAYALYVRGDSMEPWRFEGRLVYVHPGVPPRINDFVVVQLKPVQAGDLPAAYIKRLVGRTTKEIRLLQYNPRKYLNFPNGRILAIHRVMEWEELIGA